MRVIKITAIWCSACLIMNKIWFNVLKRKDIPTKSLDYDIDEDEVQKYSPGKILPVFIFYDGNKELTRVVGEKTEADMLKIIKECGDMCEKDQKN